MDIIVGSDSMPKLEDLSGQYFGFLEVIEHDKQKSKEKRHTYWKCFCHCGCEQYFSIRADGLKKGATSCKNIIKKKIREATIKDLTGQQFGELTVIELIPDTVPVKWLCKCSCDREVIRNSSSLLGHTTFSCGCMAKKKRAESQIFKHYKDLVGQKFGWWNVIELDKEKTRDKKMAYWYCKCTKCNNIYSVLGSNLLSGQTKHCRNCLESNGEKSINSFLQKTKFYYEREVSFPDLISKKGGNLRFDFIIYENNIPSIAIEYQGEQHYQAIPHWGGEEALRVRKENDLLKEEYCKNHKIKLIVIPYWDQDNMEEKYLNSILNEDYYKAKDYGYNSKT